MKTAPFLLWCVLFWLLFRPPGGQSATHHGGSGDDAARSLHSEVQTSLTFLNRTSGTITIYWLDFSGRPVLYFTLEPGHQIQQATYVSHPWMAADSDGAPLGVFYPAERPRVVDVLSPMEDDRWQTR